MTPSTQLQRSQTTPHVGKHPSAGCFCPSHQPEAFSTPALEAPRDAAGAVHSGGRLGILQEHGELLGVSGSCKTPVSGRGSRRAELSVSYHQPMGELVALAVLPHGFVIFLLCQWRASGNEIALQLVTMGRPKKIFHFPVSHTPARWGPEACGERQPVPISSCPAALRQSPLHVAKKELFIFLQTWK